MSPTRVLRRTLEQALETHLASTVLFEALGAAGSEVPQSLDDVLLVVRGPLRDVLSRRLGTEEANLLVGRVEDQLTPNEPSTVEVSLDDFALESSRKDDSTTAVPTALEAVRVMVLAGGQAFAHKLEVALGSERVDPFVVSSPVELKDALVAAPPAILLVDATDFPGIDSKALIGAAHAVPTTTACVLWGLELPYGRQFVAAIEAQHRRWVTLELREGIAPLLDLVRSRRKPRPA